MAKYLSFVFLLCFSGFLMAQDSGDEIRKLQKAFISFNYPLAIELADSLLEDRADFTEDELITIYLIRGISEFTEGNETGAGLSFLHILQYQADFELDPLNYSPKIVSFFDQVKEQFRDSFPDSDSTDIASDTTSVEHGVSYGDKVDSTSLHALADVGGLRSSSFQSVLLPGLGHISRGETTKGVLLTTASLFSFGSSVYFYFDARTKRNAYLNETDKALIESKYDSYNTSYQLRNLSFLALVTVWLYTQIDFFLVGTDLPEVQYQQHSPNSSDFSISICIPLY